MIKVYYYLILKIYIKNKYNLEITKGLKIYNEIEIPLVSAVTI